MRNHITSAARELRDMLDAQHAATVSRLLGCEVTLVRREQVRQGYRFTGVFEPVYAMPAEFVEQAQSLGLLAEAR